jgi:hypothetical protein
MGYILYVFSQAGLCFRGCSTNWGVPTLDLAIENDEALHMKKGWGGGVRGSFDAEYRAWSDHCQSDNICAGATCACRCLG